jgi:hypothetical protein
VATRDDVRRIALSLDGVTEGPDDFRFAVGGRPLAWPWLERTDPRKARIPNARVMAVRLASEFDKDPLIATDPAVFFTEPHYDGYPAILVRLASIDVELLGELVRDAWRIQAPKALVRSWDGSPPSR